MNFYKSERRKVISEAAVYRRIQNPAKHLKNNYFSENSNLDARKGFEYASTDNVLQIGCFEKNWHMFWESNHCVVSFK